MTPSSAESSLGSRPSYIQSFVDEAFSPLSSTNLSDWYHNGQYEDPYYHCEIDETLLVKDLIQKAPLGKRIYLLDVGAGNFGWCKHVAHRIDHMVKELHREDLRFFVYGLRGEISSKNPEVIGPTTLYRWGSAKIENIKDVFYEKEGDLIDQFSLIITRWTLCHLVDPIRLILDLLDLLEKGGYFLGDGFDFESFPSHSLANFLYETDLSLLLLEKMTEAPATSLQYILQKTKSEKVPCYLRYDHAYRTNKRPNRDALGVVVYDRIRFDRPLRLCKDSIFYKGDANFIKTMKSCSISDHYPFRPIEIPCLVTYEEIFETIAQEDAPEKITALYRSEKFDPMSIYFYSAGKGLSILEALAYYKRWHSLSALIDLVEEIPFEIYLPLVIFNQNFILEKIVTRFEKEERSIKMVAEEILNRTRYATTELQDLIIEKKDEDQSIREWVESSYYGPVILPFCDLPIKEGDRFCQEIQKERRKIPQLVKEALFNRQYKIYHAIIDHLPKESKESLQRLFNTLYHSQEINT